tara:strand:+ start:41 stop:634 length:594 start_codon:yes stop_codon:yes gene_type:complete
MSSVIKVDTISEHTSAGGITIDSLNIKDQKITNMVGLPVQTVSNVVSGGNVAVASTTYTDTGATVTITPQYATSKILVLARCVATLSKAADDIMGGVKLVRNVGGGSFTDLVVPMADTNGPYEQQLELTAGGNINGCTFNMNYSFLDDPDTTSACIYKLQARVYSSGSSHQWYFGNSGGGGGAQTQEMIAMEILSDS